MIFSQIYMRAIHPNHEADSSRDLVLSNHISRLASFVTPNHRDLKIPRRYQYECPWPAAQVSLSSLPSALISPTTFSGRVKKVGGFQNARGEGSVHHQGVHHHHEPPQSLPGQVCARGRRPDASLGLCKSECQLPVSSYNFSPSQVIIKANPPSLLSTVQYVDNFFRDRLVGEQCYWWMQFVGAVEFIKTMD